ncbi:MAG: hypothetical protein WCI81_02680 [Chlorobiaceae bacterium]|jgi:SGNH hydrolase-like domain, acetyltransferase AlgX
MPYIKYFLSTGLLTILLFFCLNLFLQPLSGDLTRLGNFSENDFGWNAKQPKLAIAGQDKITPNVIVLGDSFSAGNVWQSVVMMKGDYRFLTFQWDNPECLEHWIISLKKDYPETQYVIVETVERAFINRFNTTQSTTTCIKLTPQKTEPHYTASKRVIDVSYTLSDPSYVIGATINSQRNFSQTTASGLTFVSPLNRNYLFSNKRSDLLLYYTDDNLKKDWRLDDLKKGVSNIKRMQESAKRNGIVLIIAVVPDKSTTYGGFFKSPQFEHRTPDVWEELNKQGINYINLKKILISSLDKTQDLYLPNDTHFSTKGFMLMGNAVAQSLKEIHSIGAEE